LYNIKYYNNIFYVIIYLFIFLESIVNALLKYPVDCILYLHKAKELDSGIDADIEQLNEIIIKANLKNLSKF